MAITKRKIISTKQNRGIKSGKFELVQSDSNAKKASTKAYTTFMSQNAAKRKPFLN